MGKPKRAALAVTLLAKPEQPQIGGADGRCGGARNVLSNRGLSLAVPALVHQRHSQAVIGKMAIRRSLDGMAEQRLGFPGPLRVPRT